jgi:tetratricopeptide (TPR) repeat protein
MISPVFFLSALRLHPVAAIVLYVALALTLVSCGRGSKEEGKKEPLRFDHVADALPFPRPVFEPLGSLSGVPEIPEKAQRTLDLRRAFFARDFARLDQAMTAAHDKYVNGLSDQPEAGSVLSSIGQTQLAGIDVCHDWLQAMPESYSAHWLCGAIWQSGAWAARGDKSASEVSQGQFLLMKERLQRSNALLEQAVKLTPKPIEVLSMLAANYYLAGDRPQANALLLRAEQIMPQNLAIYEVKLHYLLPEWGGSKEEVIAGFEQAKRNGVGANDLIYLEDEFIVRPAKISTPGAAKSYLVQAIGQHSTRYRLEQLVSNYVWLENWQEALPVANRLIDEYPDNEKGYYQRASINEKLGRISEARDDYRMAAAMGHDYSLQTLVMAHIRGGLGLPGKSFENMIELCRYGATLGSATGANCIGSLSYEGGSADVPFQKNLPQAFAWHLMGARAGHFNSQYDLGWLMYTGRGPGVESGLAKSNGTFWLRRAAENGHHYAKQKLQENSIAPSEENIVNTSEDLDVDLVMSMLYKILRIIL